MTWLPDPRIKPVRVARILGEVTVGKVVDVPRLYAREHPTVLLCTDRVFKLVGRGDLVLRADSEAGS